MDASGQRADDQDPSPNKNTKNGGGRDDDDDDDDEEATTRPPNGKNISTTDDHGDNVTKTIRRLRAAPPSPDYAPEIRTQVLAVLELWADTTYRDDKYRSFLHKRTLQHEIEECLPALHHLNEWRKQQQQPHVPTRQQQQQRFVAVDVCGGKGYFALLVRYCASLYWNHDNDGAAIVLDHVILLDKQQQQRSSSGSGQQPDKKQKKKDGRINWNHLTDVASSTDTKEQQQQLVPIVLWDDCNLHETDALVDRLLQIETRGVNNSNNDSSNTHSSPPPLLLALTGIHLCKMLSPALVGLVNRLGPARCPYLCLVPCCLPRAVTKMGRNKKKNKTSKVDNDEAASSLVRVFTYETPDARAARLQRVQERRGRVATSGCCYGCQSTQHVLRDCPVAAVTMTKPERQQMFRQRQPPNYTPPCWKCGLPGHFQVDCRVRQDRGSKEPPPPQQRQQRRDQHPLISIASSPLEPPVVFLDCTHVLASPDPLRTYCDLLLGTLDGADYCDDNKNNIGEVEDHDPNVVRTNNSGSSDSRHSSDSELPPTAAKHPAPTAASSSGGGGGWSSRCIHASQLVGKLKAGQQPGNWNGQRKSLYIVAQQ